MSRATARIARCPHSLDLLCFNLEWEGHCSACPSEVPAGHKRSLWTQPPRVTLPPMLRDVTALSDPDVVAVRLDIVEQLLEAGRELGVANSALVQPYGHHLG
eukprot:CAMPEP_0174707494 /NCGR_PEP_ID=MMETSP1094-20130205/9992_1 /TAXON_ID=156173 /ORGANISM="Chrysochromulina brevifilum, Strain UTEX LB 985" /LENGTH=101 /DNA_ID=CAMNT_0015905881 /DNA_START=29 /DNA_END=334 /DNA_ORIENTATION=-